MKPDENWPNDRLKMAVLSVVMTQVTSINVEQSLNQASQFECCANIQNFKSNRIVTSVFESIRNEHNYSKFWNTYCHRFLTYLTEWRRFFTLATTPSNQQNLLLTMVQVLYLLEVFILAHYGPPSTETPTTTIAWCHKNSWIYLTSTYYWRLLRPTKTILFYSKFQIIAQLFDLIRNEKKTLFAQHYNLSDETSDIIDQTFWWWHRRDLVKQMSLWNP